jgi:hypothetical protein
MNLQAINQGYSQMRKKDLHLDYCDGNSNAGTNALSEHDVIVSCQTIEDEDDDDNHMIRQTINSSMHLSSKVSSTKNNENLPY